MGIMSKEELVVEQRKSGYTYKEIVEKVALNYGEVARILKAHGLTEPHYKYKREDVIRPEELDQILTKAGELQMFGLSGIVWQALVSIMWLYGKRVSEIVSLKTQAIRVNGEYLTILFNVLKKEGRKDPGVLQPFTKRVTLENPYTNFVINWWKQIPDETFLFPRPQTKMGHIYRQYAHLVLKEMSPRISSHLFRHSLATQMAEQGATAYELVNWFDWDRTDTALEYIRRSGAMTQRLSNRRW